jgi:cytochrome P450
MGRGEMLVDESARVGIETVPSHVPTERVVPYDMLRVSGPRDDPFSVMHQFREKGPIFYTPVHFSNANGAWVLTRAEDIRAALQNPVLFSSKGVSGFSRLLGERWDMIPLELDPSCISLIEALKQKSDCEFMRDFGRPFPVLIFLQLMGLPAADFHQVLEWEDLLLQGKTLEVRVAAAAAIRDYLRELAQARREHPVHDLISFVVQARVDGEPLKDDEILGVCYLLFVGGLDTVASSLGFYFKYLAENPKKQQLLRENNKLIPDAVEELLRIHSVVMVSRFVTEDTEFGGVAMKKGDCIAIYMTFASFDPEEIDQPEMVEFARSPNRHVAFSFGPHRCIGSHLARRELVIAIEEWVNRVPSFEIKPGADVRMHGGVVFGVDQLPLTWSGQA